MRSRPFLIALMSASLFTLPNNSFAIQQGDVCKKAGVIKRSGGVTFTCVKKGKKLVWRERKTPETNTAPQVSPSPSPIIAENPFRTPFPDVFNRGDLTSAVIKSFEAYVASNSSPKNYKLVIGPEFENSREEIKSFVDRSYALLPFPKDYQKSIIVISKSGEFGEKEIKEFGFDRSDSNRANGGPCINCANEGWATSDDGLGAVTPHEIFHIWQKSAYKRKGNNNLDPSNPLNPPVWFNEGSADLFGYLIYKERTKFYQGVGSYRDYQPLKMYSTRNLDPWLPYVLGRVASEYIVASVGMERFLQIFFNVGEGLDFPSAFEKATGVTLDFFYEKFDKNIRNMF